jgi:hypothetical protein
LLQEAGKWRQHVIIFLQLSLVIIDIVALPAELEQVHLIPFCEAPAAEVFDDRARPAIEGLSDELLPQPFFVERHGRPESDVIAYRGTLVKDAPEHPGEVTLLRQAEESTVAADGTIQFLWQCRTTISPGKLFRVGDRYPRPYPVPRRRARILVSDHGRVDHRFVEDAHPGEVRQLDQRKVFHKPFPQSPGILRHGELVRQYQADLPACRYEAITLQDERHIKVKGPRKPRPAAATRCLQLRRHLFCLEVRGVAQDIIEAACVFSFPALDPGRFGIIGRAPVPVVDGVGPEYVKHGRP